MSSPSDLADHINSIIVNNPATFPTHWKLRAKIVMRDGTECVTLTHSGTVSSKQAWTRFDLRMDPNVSSQVT